jgi:hypothetical protein
MRDLYRLPFVLRTAYCMIARSTNVIIQNRDGSIAREPTLRRLNKHKRRDYYAAVPAHLLDEHSSLIDRIISFAFETLDVSRLEVRVYDEPDAPAQCDAGALA